MSDMWDLVADGWERNAAFVESQLGAATGTLLDLARVQDGDAVLDLACGAGAAGIAAAARVGTGGRVVLADAAAEMVAVAARRTAEMPQARALVGDLAAIDAPPSTFDAVLCRHGLMFAADPQAAIREAVRVLRGGGRYAVMTWAARDANPWLGLAFDAVGAQFGVPFPPPGVPGPFAHPDPEALGALLAGGGLEDVEVRALTTPMWAASPADWWARVPALAGPLAVGLAAMEPGVRDEIGARAMAACSAAARTAGDGIELDGAVLVAAGRRPG